MNQSTRYSLGFQTLDLAYPGQEEHPPLTLGVWYPCTGEGQGQSLDVGVQVRENARIMPGRFPLVIFSHGFTDSAVQGRYLAETLASRGWIVAAPDHHDPFWRWRIRGGRIRRPDRRGIRDAVQVIANSTPADRHRYAYRLEEMETALQGLLTTDPFASAVIEDKIVVCGHSFGGFTALGLCGPLPDRFDPRIKAGVLLSSNSTGLFYRSEERRSVQVPVMLCTGQEERNNRLGPRRVADWAGMIFSDLPLPKYFLEIKGATHASFSAGFEDESSPEAARAVAHRHQIISEYVVAFVHRHVLGEEDAQAVLAQQHPLLTQYIQRAGKR